MPKLLPNMTCWGKYIGSLTAVICKNAFFDGKFTASIQSPDRKTQYLQERFDTFKKASKVIMNRIN